MASGERHRGQPSWVWFVYTGAVVSAFVWVFLFQALQAWAPTYARFNVPVMGYPGGDSRNIQEMAHCLRGGDGKVATTACMARAEAVRVAHPEAHVPPYNYPAVWAEGYAWLADDTEASFLVFWRANAGLLILALVACCWHFRSWALPALLLSPVTLLTIERGNIDATTFAVALLALLSPWGRWWLGGTALGLAAAMKVYPVVGWGPLWREAWLAGRWRSVALASALCLPAVAWTFLEVSRYVAGTSTGFPFSYGLLALAEHPAMAHHGGAKWMVAGAGLASLGLVWGGLWARPAWRDSADAAWRGMPGQDAVLMSVCLTVYVATFLVFTNWSYRLVFLLPALLLAWRQRGMAFRCFAWLAGGVLWLPLFRHHGWEVQTWLCYPLAGVSLFLLSRWWVGRADART